MARASNDGVENVLILRFGGSLGALGCQGVFKAFREGRVKINFIIAGHL